ncbi:MAG: GGDEF domain-containing protein [Treponema sp.]|nr:GGDEF domain-containing protein [Treponema sp.]
MSKKKERKIRKLQHTPVWHRVLGIILSRTGILLASFVVIILSISAVANSITIPLTQENRNIVIDIEQNWTSANGEAALTQIAAKYEDIQAVSVVNAKDNSVIAQSTPPLEQSYIDYVLKHYDATTFKEEGRAIVLHENQNFEIDFDYSSGFFGIGNLFNMLNVLLVMEQDELLNWSTPEQMGIDVCYYARTELPDTNLLVKSRFSFNNYQFKYIMLLATIFFIFLQVCIIIGVLKIIAAIAEQQRINQLVATDTVTGGNNKAYFIQKSNSLLRRSRRPYAIVQLRLEKYRNYCTAYGVKQGENLLEDIDKGITAHLVKKEFSGHMNESDFALLLFFDSKEALTQRLNSLMDDLRKEKTGQHLSFTAGAIEIAFRTNDCTELLTHAGNALSHADSTKDSIVWFTEAMKEEQVWERRIEDDMERALENHEFVVYLQPKYSTKKEKLSAAEALVRWIHPELGFIPPGKFIPQFEKNGFILQLDDYMLDEVCKLQAAWLSQGKQLVPISVNVSRAHFAQDNLAEHIVGIVNRYNVPHEFIELELTESAFFDDKQALLTTVNALKNYGFKISMDDFGAGYSSLNSLKELPLDIIKLDAEFFRSVDDIKRSNQIVGDTISLAKKLGMQIVAEGIETREQVDFLAKQNCDLIQGFYFSKPLPVSEFEERAGY